MTQPATSSHDAGQSHGAHHAHPNYMAIFGILIVLTVLSVFADLIRKKIGVTPLILIVLAIASFKALCVMMYFMHLKFEGAWKYALLAPTVILALAVPAALAPDIAFKYYDAQNPQQKALREQEAEHAALERHATPAGAHSEAHPETEAGHEKH